MGGWNYEWIKVWENEIMNGLKYGRMKGWMDLNMGEWKDEWIKVWENERMNGLKYGRMKGWMD